MRIAVFYENIYDGAKAGTGTGKEGNRPRLRPQTGKENALPRL